MYIYNILYIYAQTHTGEHSSLALVVAADEPALHLLLDGDQLAFAHRQFVCGIAGEIKQNLCVRVL